VAPFSPPFWPTFFRHRHSRNRNRNAAKRTADLAARVDDEDDWATHFRAYHLGGKLISLALQHAVFEGKPIFEEKQDLEGSGKRLKNMQRIGLTEAAETWIGEQTPEALDLFNPIYVPMRGGTSPVDVAFGRRLSGDSDDAFQASDREDSQCSFVIRWSPY
jgi:hypothetical protein